ncbi:MAG: YjgN family protein [Gammaproteobacteria bacterium]
MTDAPSSRGIIAGGGEERINAKFGGTAAEYFRIWLVNTLLTIITLGFYSPWAKVRNKRYFYGCTWIGGANFEYHAKPLAILVARLVLLAVFAIGAIWSGEDIVRDAYYSLVLLIFLPWAIVRGLSFNARNSSWSGIRFSFTRDYAPIYLIYLPFLMLSGVGGYLQVVAGRLPEVEEDAQIPDEVMAFFWLAGILVLCFLLLMAFSPFLVRAYHRYKAGRHKLGNLQFYLHKPPVSGYYGATMLPYFVVPLFSALTAGLMILIAGGLFADDMEKAREIGAVVFGGVMVLSYLVVVWITQAMLFRLFWDNLRARNDKFEARFVCDVDIWHFAFHILLVNTLATILSLGFLYPWAKVRKTKYLVLHIHIIAPAGALASLTARKGEEESAFGEELDVAEGFDFDVGLI